MRFMVMHKVDANMEAGRPPSQHIIQRMGELVQEGLKSGVFQNGAGLHRSTQRVRLEFKGGERTVTAGPLTGRNELVASFVVIRARSLDEATVHAGRFAKVWGDGEIEIGPVVEPWDLGLAPKPAGDPPGRFLLLQKSSRDAERGVPMDATARRALDALKKQMMDEGVILAAEELAPSAKGSRLASGTQSQRRWTDGPFAESKELIAGFSILDLPSKQAALAWADRYAAILDGNEVDVRELAGSSS
jgi:hypothetical protein